MIASERYAPSHIEHLSAAEAERVGKILTDMLLDSKDEQSINPREFLAQALRKAGVVV